MVETVITINLLVSILCLYMAWRVWQLKGKLAKVAKTLNSAERSMHRVLYRAPEAIARGELSIYQLRQGYRRLQPKLQQARQAIALFTLCQTLWQQRFALPGLSRRNQSSRRKTGATQGANRS